MSNRMSLMCRLGLHTRLVPVPNWPYRMCLKCWTVVAA